MTAKRTTPLRRYRLSQTLTLEEFTGRLERLGVNLSLSHIARIERDGTGSLATAIALSKATGLPVESFKRLAATDEEPAER